MQGGLVETATFKSDGIADGDGEKLESGLSGMQGVRDVEADGAGHSVRVSYDPTVVDENAVRAAVENLGYPIDGSSAVGTSGTDPTGYDDDAPLT